MRVLVVVLSLTICAAGCAQKARPQSPQPVTPEASAPPKTAPAKPATTATSQAEDKDKSAPQAAKPATSAAAPTKPAASAPPANPAAPATPAKPVASAPTAKPAPSPAKPPSTATAKPARPAATKPATPATATAKPPVATKPAAPASNPTLDLTELKDQLKSTKAIGLMTKLTLKNQVDDLLDGFRDHYAGKGKSSISQLRQSYDMLMMKVLSLLQDKDQKLASNIVASREVIWGLLADPKKFAALDV
jgi:hypothetical protein